eukprot:288098-Ditylum_brightwellii.AAC.1
MMPKKMQKKSSGMITVYTITKKHFLVLNVGVVKLVLESGGEWCMESYGDPAMSPEVRDIKLVWLQIQAKSKCSTGLRGGSLLYSEVEEEDNDDKSDNEEELSQDLLAPDMAQKFP